jgi:hypothetical protein
LRAVLSYVYDPQPRDRESPDACFDRLVGAAAGWVAAECGSGFRVAFDGRPCEPRPGRRLTAALSRFDARHRLMTLDWIAPDPDAPSVVWGCGVELALAPLGLQAAVNLRVGAAGTSVTPTEYQVHRPGVIDALFAAAPGYVLGQPIPTRPRVVSDRFVPGFVRDTLTSPNRVLPVVLVSPDPHTGKPLVDVGDLAHAVLGLAEVVELDRPSTTFALTNELGKEWSCFLGAVRIYWPGLDPDADDYRRHTIFFADHIRFSADRDPVEQQIFRRLVGAGNLRFSDAPRVREARAAAERQKQEEFQAQLNKLKVGEQAADEVLKAWDAAQAENARLRDDLAAAQGLSAELTDQLQAMKEQFEVVSRESGRLAGEGRAASAPGEVRRPLDALRRAEADFADVLLVLPSAVKSAADSPYQRADELFDLLTAVGAVARAWKAGRLCTGWYHALQAFGFEYKDDISVTSAGKFGADYTFVYDGQKRLFENHVTLGAAHNPQKCLSVHWYRDETRKRVVIGWCGKHLTNTKT